MKFLKTYAFTLAALLSTALWAGPSVGGGGDVIVLPDDTVILADPFIDSGAPQPNNMPPLRAMNPRILQVINLYNKASSALIKDFAAKESDINVTLAKLAMRNNDLRFYGVQSAEELNQFCAPGGRKIYKLPNGAQVQQVACTAGAETFIVEPLFIRLSLRDQGLLLIHERLTTLRDQFGGKNYSAIARFTTGLNVYLNIYSEQNKKKYRLLSAEEQKTLTDFYVAIEEIEKRNSEVTDDSFQWIAHRNGGARTHAAAIVDETALISLNSVIPKKSEIAPNTKILDYFDPYLLPLSMEEGASIENLSISFSQYSKPQTSSHISLGRGATLSGVSLSNFSGVVSFGENAEVKNSVLSVAYLTTGQNFRLINGVLLSSAGRVGDNVSILRSKLEGKMTLGSSVLIENSTFDDFKNVDLASGVSVKGSNITGEVFLVGKDSVLENTRIHVSELGLGSSVVFREAFIDYRYLNATVANGEQLIQKGVSSSTYENYYPLGYVPAPVTLNFDVPAFKCVLTEKLPKKITDVKLPLLNGNGDGAVITGQIQYQGKVSIFRDEYNYDYNGYRVAVTYKTFTRATDKSLLMISPEGKFVNPDYKRENLVISLESITNNCERSAIVSALNDYYRSSSNSIVISSGR